MIRTRTIDGGLSLVLDTLRLSASIVVLLSHARDMWFPASAHAADQPGDAAHAAVVVFFVLSGFVIAFTASARHRTLSDYMAARLARLWSMCIPALLLTAVVELIVRFDADPNLLASYVRGAFGPRYAITGSFMNEIWLFSAAPPANIALWSLSFEFWYYLIFGLWFCTGRGWKSLLFAACACLLAGPKIVLMMPIWLMGCAAYWLPRPRLGPRLAWFGAACGFAVALWLVTVTPPWPMSIGHAPFYFGNQFGTDWLVGLFVALGLWLVPGSLPVGVRPASDRLVRRVRTVADLTFPIYVLHFPLLVLCQVVMDKKIGDPVQYATAVAVTLSIASVLGVLLEKQRPRWSQLLAWIVAGVAKRVGGLRRA